MALKDPEMFSKDIETNELKPTIDLSTVFDASDELDELTSFIKGFEAAARGHHFPDITAIKELVDGLAKGKYGGFETN